LILPLTHTKHEENKLRGLIYFWSSVYLHYIYKAKKRFNFPYYRPFQHRLESRVGFPQILPEQTNPRRDSYTHFIHIGIKKCFYSSALKSELYRMRESVLTVWRVNGGGQAAPTCARERMEYIICSASMRTVGAMYTLTK
jgi:hypothetical protein